jgi:hypothetical protein
MSLSRFGMFSTVAAVVLALAASDAAAFPAIGGANPPKPGVGQQGKGRGGKKNNKGKQGGPLDAAIKDLKQADKDLEAKKSSQASQLTHAAEQIVSQASKQAHGQGGDADKGKSLDAVLKDIREAEKQIANRKPDDASTAIKSAITALEGLSGAKKK